MSVPVAAILRLACALLCRSMLRHTLFDTLLAIEHDVGSTFTRVEPYGANKKLRIRSQRINR